MGLQGGGQRVYPGKMYVFAFFGDLQESVVCEELWGAGHVLQVIGCLVVFCHNVPYTFFETLRSGMFDWVSRRAH